MSLSRSERFENIELALKLIMEKLGDSAIDELFVEIDKPPDEKIYPTTWQHLEDQYFIARRDTLGGRYRRLTASGWLEGLRITGLLEVEEMKEKVGEPIARNFAPDRPLLLRCRVYPVLLRLVSLPRIS